MEIRKGIGRLFSLIGDSFIHLLYPPSCLHCGTPLEDHRHILCGPCLQLMELIDPLERCSLCFSADCNTLLRLCQTCYQSPRLLDGIAASFDFLGPSATLVKKLKYANMPYLAEGMAAYLTAQFCQLEWPMPEAIVPVPLSFTHYVDRGYNQSALLAHYFAKFIQCPAYDILKRKSGGFSQAGLNRSQRVQLGTDQFSCKKCPQLQNKIVLLIDDVMTTGTTLKRCAEALQMSYPKKIYALVFCRAVR